MWDGTLVFNVEQGSIKELIDMGVSILGAKKLRDARGKWQVKCRFTQETLEKIMDSANLYTWSGKWTGKGERQLNSTKPFEG